MKSYTVKFRCDKYPDIVNKETITIKKFTIIANNTFDAIDKVENSDELQKIKQEFKEHILVEIIENNKI